MNKLKLEIRLELQQERREYYYCPHCDSFVDEIIKIFDARLFSYYCFNEDDNVYRRKDVEGVEQDVEADELYAIECDSCGNSLQHFAYLPLDM